MKEFLRAAGLCSAGPLLLGGCIVSDINLRNMQAHARAGYAAEQAGDWDGARRQFAQAVMNAQMGGAPVLVQAPLNHEYGRSLGVRCSWDMAERFLLRSKQLAEQGGQTPYLDVLELALLERSQGKQDKAAAYFEELFPLIEKEQIEARYPLGVAEAYDFHAEALEATGRQGDAQSSRSKARGIRLAHPAAKPFGSVTPYGTQCSESPEKAARGDASAVLTVK